MMKVILNQDITDLGEEGDIKAVSDGYARNYLIPKKLAVVYNKQNIKILESRRVIIEKRKEEKKIVAQDLKDRVEAEEIVIKMQAGDNGKLFGSVNAALIAEELEKKGYSIERKKIEVPDKSIRMLGQYSVKVRLYGEETAILNIKIENLEKK